MWGAVMIGRKAIGMIAAVLCVLPAMVAATEAREWLERMNRALAEQSYEGTFFHERGGHSESLRIHHRVKDGTVDERLVSLDGAQREFIRRGDEIMYVLPDQRAVLIERRSRGGGLLPHFPRFDDHTARFYRLEPIERTRVIGRAAQLVSLTPLDPYRYGYRVWIDARSALPLKTETYDRRGRVLERISFANLQLAEIPDETFAPGVSVANFRRIESDRGVRLTTVGDSSAVWNVQTMPRGFRLTQRAEQALPGTVEPVSHLVFSDGLVSVSVFIGARLPPRASKEIALERQIGASTAYSTFVHGHHVVVVGEIPVETAKLIATQLRPQAPAESGRPGTPGRPAEPSKPREAFGVVQPRPALAPIER